MIILTLCDECRELYDVGGMCVVPRAKRKPKSKCDNCKGTGAAHRVYDVQSKRVGKSQTKYSSH